MSEHLSAPKHESLQNKGHEVENKHLEALREKAEADHAEHTESGKLEAIQKSVEQVAISGKEMAPAESSANKAPAATYFSRELKKMTFNRSLNNARRHMGAPSKALSKVIHQPVIERVSEVAGATVARPSGILGGGLFAVLGSAILLYVTKHYGYHYNYLIFGMLFVGGFAAGMIVELVLRTVIRKKS